MEHIHTFALFESETRRDFAGELHHALYETQAGKDLLAITSHRFREKEKISTTFKVILSSIAFSSAIVKPWNGMDGKPTSWIWQYASATEGPPYIHGGSFFTAEECLSNLWLDLVVSLCEQIFADDKERIFHEILVKDHIQILSGHAYETMDLIYLIDNLKGIVEGKVEPSVANILRKDFPSLWQTMSDQKGGGYETIADLGELGF